MSSEQTQRLQIKSHKYATVWLALGLGLLLTLPSLWVGLQLDDYFHWGLVTDRNEIIKTNSPGSVYGLFSFMNGDSDRAMKLMNLGFIPWWTNPEVEYQFWRPLTEITHGLDYTFWPQHPSLMHAHSLIYFALMLWFGFRLFAQLQMNSTAWLLACFLFAVSYTHGAPVGWLANRNAELAVLFVILTLTAHHQWRQQQRTIYGLVASLFFVLGLLSGEMAVTAGAYIFSYALFYEKSSWRKRIHSLLPYVAIGLIWLSIRAMLGYGVSGSGDYLDPLSTPNLFLDMFLERFLNLLGGLFLAIPPELASGLPPSRVWIYLVSTLVILWVSLPLLRDDRRARFLLSGALLCLIPAACTVPHSRLLIAASVGTAGYFGLLFNALFAGLLRKGKLAKYVSVLVVGALIVLNLGLSTIVLPFEIILMKNLGDKFLNHGAISWDLNDLPKDTTAILINPPLSGVGGYINGIRSYNELPIASKTWLLASGMKPIKLTVLDEFRLELESKEGLYDGKGEGVLRSPEVAFSPGDLIQLDGMRITVIEVDSGVPTNVIFEFANPLNSAHYRFSHWHKGAIANCQLPKVTESIVLKLDSEECATIN